MKKKILVFIMVLALAFSCSTVGIFATENAKALGVTETTVGNEFIDLNNDVSYEFDDETAQKMDKFIEEFENQLEFNNDEIVTDDVNLKYFKEKYGKQLVQSVENNIEDLNKLADEGDIEITPNGTIYDANEDDMYVQGKVNINKGTTYWWGRINYVSYSNANKLKKSLGGTSGRSTVLSLVVGAGGLFKATAAVLGPFSLAFGAVSAYTTYFCKRITACNKKNKGIKYKLYWTMNYTMRTQGSSW